MAETAPELARRLKLDEGSQRTIPFTLAELKTIKEKARGALRQVGVSDRLELVFGERRLLAVRDILKNKTIRAADSRRTRICTRFFGLHPE